MGDEVRVLVDLMPGMPGGSLLMFNYSACSLVLQVDKPEQLAKWLAFLFEQRDLPHPSSAPVKMIVGHFGPNPVEFSLEGEEMMLITGVPEPHKVLTPGPLEKGWQMLIPSLTFYMPRDRLNELADGLARAHRGWVEWLGREKPGTPESTGV